MHLGLEDKVVLVTGGTKGIGAAIVKGFLQEGATVHFCSRTAADVEAANEIYAPTRDRDARAIGAVVDVSDKKALTQWVNDCARESGRIDVVVANVASFQQKDTVECWEKSFETDFMGGYILIEAATPHLEKTKGNIVSIGATGARQIDLKSPSSYNALKAAMVNYIAQLAHVLAPKGIRANTVSPGNIWVEGGIWPRAKSTKPEIYEKQLARNKMGRMGNPEEVANMVVFVASNEKASFVSGANLMVDGALCEGVQY